MALAQQRQAAAVDKAAFPYLVLSIYVLVRQTLRVIGTQPHLIDDALPSPCVRRS
jgi:hypothetical protein